MENKALVKPTFNTEDVPAFTAGVSRKVDLEPTGGTPPYKCDITDGDLPEGLSFSSEGVIYGTATRPNDDNPPTVFFRVTDSKNESGTRAYPVTVVAGASAKGL
jgi:large repetitive protein